MKRKILCKRFCAEHKFVLVGLLISVFVIAKCSKLQYVFPVFEWVKNIMECPSDDSVRYDFWNVINNLSLAYISSFIFYIMINYFPALKNEKRAYLFIKRELTQLNKEISTILGLYICNLGIDKRISEVEEDDISMNNTIELKNTASGFLYQYWDENQEMVKRGKIYADYYKMFSECSERIQKLTRSIMDKPLSAFFGQDLLEVFTKVNENVLLNLNSNELYELAMKHRYEFKIDNFISKFDQIVQIYCYFNCYDFPQYDCQVRELTMQEIKECKKNQQEVGECDN